jgi:hypothetical protein
VVIGEIEARSGLGRQGPVGHAMEPIAGHADVEWLAAAGSVRPARFEAVALHERRLTDD